MATTYHNDIQKLYVAYFNRPADPAGLAYWETVVEAASGNTAAVSAAFAASAEYQAAYADYTTTGTLRQIYVNLFNAVADEAGLAYWSDLVATNKIQMSDAVTAIAAGAQGVHKTTYNNKVLVAAAFTTAVNTDAEKAAYTGTLANAAAKKFLATITTDATATAALATAAMDASVAAVVKASTPFTLQGALNSYNAAVQAKAAFLVTADGDTNAATSATEASITQKVTDAKAAFGTVTGTLAGDAIVVGYDAAPTAGQKAAILADEVTTRATAVTNATKALATAVAAVETKGITALVANVKAADAALTAATNAEIQTQSNMLGAETNFELRNTTFAAGNISIDATTGAVANLIVVSGTTVALAANVTEVTNPGVTALLAAIQADLLANKSKADAATASAKAHVFLDIADASGTAGSDTALIAIGQAFATPLTPNTTKPSLAQVQTEIASLATKVATAQAAVDAASANGGTPTVAQTNALTAAKAAVTTFETKLSDFNTANAANLVADTQVTAEAGVKTAQTAQNALNTEIAAVTAAEAVAKSLAAVNDVIKAAGATFVENKYIAPVTLDSFVVATTASDIFVAGSTNASLFGFAKGDILFIGEKYTVNKGALSTGNDAVLEAFMTQSGLDTVISLETKNFGSGSTDAEIVITLTGVNVADVHFANGIITV